MVIDVDTPKKLVAFSPSGMKFCREILDTLSYHMVKTRSLYLTWAWNDTGT